MSCAPVYNPRACFDNERRGAYCRRSHACLHYGSGFLLTNAAHRSSFYEVFITPLPMFYDIISDFIGPLKVKGFDPF